MLIQPRFQYISVTAVSIAVTPTWTPIGTPLTLPAAQLIVTSNSNADFEISFDGVTPVLFLQDQATPQGALYMDFARNYTMLPAGTQIFARRVVAGAVGSLRITVMQWPNQGPPF